jgi:catechol 2,3-dioxygenase-like lactoylglutathione lyase family enzyme
MTKAHFILYVSDQARSTEFYRQVLDCPSTLNVPGMTEFTLADQCVLGLMPEASIKRLLGEKLPDPAAGNGLPRAELYLLVPRPQEYHRRAIECGAIELSGMAIRDWGHRAAYSLDPDGHVLAFAESLDSE